MLAACHNNQFVTIRERTTGNQICCFYTAHKSQNTLKPVEMCFSPHNEMLFIGFSDNTIIMARIKIGRSDWSKATAGFFVDWDPIARYQGSIRSLAFLQKFWLVVLYRSESSIKISCHGDRLQKFQELKSGGSATAMPFSQEGRLFASSDTAGNIRIWASEGDQPVWTLQQTLATGEARHKLIFSEDGQYLQTDLGPIVIEPTHPGDLAIKRQGLSNILIREDCIEWGPPDNRKVMHLPFEYRPDCSDVYDNTLVMGHASGRITCMELT